MSAVITSGYGPAILQFLIVNGTLSSSSGKVVYEDPENPNMSWMVTADQKDFYAALESESEGKIARLRRQPNGQLTKQEVVSSLGGAPCHLALDKTRKVLFVTNYVNSLSAFQLDDEGKISYEIFNDRYGAGSNVVPDRQGDAHPHGVYLYNDFVFVVDLGADKIWRYRITKAASNGKTHIEKVGSTDTPLGWGPRHMTIKNDTAYVIFELETRIGVFNIDPLLGELNFVAALPTVSEKIINGKPQYGAEIAVHPNGKWLFVSNRGHGPLCVYHIDENADDKLTLYQVTDFPDVWPRHFSIRPDGKSLWLVEQHKNLLQEWIIDQENGSVTLGQEVTLTNNPAFVLEV